MSVLSPIQLEKPYHPNHEYYGKFIDRGEKFLEKIKNKEPFELSNGSFVIIDILSEGVKYLKSKEYKQLGGGKKLFKTNIGDLSLSKFEKTKEFGSNSGTSSGTKNTSIQESTQCVFNSMIYSLKREYLDVEDITLDNISSSYQYCDTTTPWEDIYEFSQIPSWQQSFLTSSNLLYDYNQEMNYSHHRDSDFINSLYNSYKNSELNLNSDKWNPSDIWLVKDNVLNQRFSSSIDDLNMQLENMFDKKELIGVSLKKLGKDSKIELKNHPSIKKKKYIYKGYKSTIKSKDIRLLFNEGEICFRTFSYATSWNGEILGNSASHGKIGGGILSKILHKFSIKLPKSKDIKELVNTESGIQLLSKMLNNFIKHEENSLIFINDKNIDWRVSKLMGLILLEMIEEKDEDTQNEIITEIISYASSELNDSSVFIKIS